MTALAVWKTAHVLSAAILFGTGIGIAFFCWFSYRAAVRSGEIAVLRSALRWTVVADACFTAPAVLFQAISGVILMHMMGWPLVSSWSATVWSLFVLTGACWLPVVAIQVRLSREAASAASVSALSTRFHYLFRWWLGLGIPAFSAVVIIFYFMVAKPLAISSV